MQKLLLLLLLITPVHQLWASNECCAREGGIHYCDSSAGRSVCKNGVYSSCYCTRHAIMDLQKLEGCCLWHGGLFKIGAAGAVICNDSSVSEICSLGTPKAY